MYVNWRLNFAGKADVYLDFGRLAQCTKLRELEFVSFENFEEIYPYRFPSLTTIKLYQVYAT